MELRASQPVVPALRLPAALAREIANLHPNQRRAVQHEGNLVLIAGPGAGKTRTLVARVGHLLALTSSHRGVAAITYTDAAASEVTSRLRGLGMHPGRRLASRTVHAFCMHHILRPYARFTDVPFSDDLTLLDEKQSNNLWALACHNNGLPVKDKPEAVLTKLRRLLAAGEDLDGFPSQYIQAVRMYEQLLIDNDALDFDAMPNRALAVLRSSEPARTILAARFPHVVVDEYQDLGPVLHAVVTELLDSGVQVTAVGDPDQTMYAFQGADTRYLTALNERADFTAMKLSVNFRSGGKLVAAGRAVLGGKDRGYKADPANEAPGAVTLEEVDGDLDGHAKRAVDVVRQRIAGGVPAEDIAVLYRGDKSLLNQLTKAFVSAGIPCDMERTRKIPTGGLADLVSACAARRLAGPVPGPAEPVPQTRSEASAADTGPAASRRKPLSAMPTKSLPELAATWHRYRKTLGLTVAGETPRVLARTLLAALDAPDREGTEDDASEFLEVLMQSLDIDQLAALSTDLRDRDAPKALRTAVRRGLTMAELAGGRAPGRIALTTYHSAKGREFSVVILPGLVDGLMPFHFATRPISGRDLSEQRRNFYVAVTRAQDEVVLIAGDHFTDPYYPGVRRTRRSRFVDAILEQVDSQD
ncbi:ATP-dependent helicase [Streptomyces sp. NPDC002181]|uniref:ATP-dependent helicase n=1 Tax=Streptomyces sp. NPDC002181 TaxID=3364635 RepID=UPI00368AD1CB